jgi:hypothetical protein
MLEEKKMCEVARRGGGRRPGNQEPIQQDGKSARKIDNALFVS